MCKLCINVSIYDPRYRSMNKMYGFEGEVLHKYDTTVMRLFGEVFANLPLAAVIQVLEGLIYFFDLFLDPFFDLYFDLFSCLIIESSMSFWVLYDVCRIVYLWYMVALARRMSVKCPWKR